MPIYAPVFKRKLDRVARREEKTAAKRRAGGLGWMRHGQVAA